uniref:Ig-like domain-containing protein n=1 Tax=Mastacembelus armatus TaxID=205130 RepID=A0A3Q3LBL5_9TELE
VVFATWPQSVLTLRVSAQQLTVWPEVTGYLGHNVTLPCKFNSGAKGTAMSQVQWDLLQPEGKNIIIIVSSVQHGAHIHESSLKGRVGISEESLIIKSVEMRDAGSYTCRVATFPSGSFEGTTKLIVLGEAYLCYSGCCFAAGRDGSSHSLPHLHQVCVCVLCRCVQ